MKDLLPEREVSCMERSIEPTTRHSLVLRLRNLDDERAWAEFIQIYEPLVYRLALAKGLQHADAQDVCQDVFRAVASAIERWDPDPAKGSFRGWLFRITRNLLVNFLTARARNMRGTGRSSIQEMLEAQPASDSRAQAEVEAEFKRRAFQWAADQVKHEFTDSTWQAFWKTGVDNHRVADVAKQLGLSEGAVYIARSRVLARLRRCVEQLTGDFNPPGGGSNGHTI
jgi:RNA polymerase sigma-70 factor (ECF subfamily)